MQQRLIERERWCGVRTCILLCSSVVSGSSVWPSPAVSSLSHDLTQCGGEPYAVDPTMTQTFFQHFSAYSRLSTFELTFRRLISANLGWIDVRLQAASCRFSSSEQRLWRDLQYVAVAHPRSSSSFRDHHNFDWCAGGYVCLDAASYEEQDASSPVER
jgi:hypothetical protein